MMILQEIILISIVCHQQKDFTELIDNKTFSDNPVKSKQEAYKKRI